MIIKITIDGVSAKIPSSIMATEVLLHYLEEAKDEEFMENGKSRLFTDLDDLLSNLSEVK